MKTEKERCYDEALERARKLQETCDNAAVSGQAWSCVQYPTSPYFQAMPMRNGVCYPTPTPVEWNANLIIARECIREVITKRSSLRYIKPMIVRCVVVDWARYWVLKPEDRKNYLRKGVTTKKELMDVIKRYGTKEN